MRRFALLTAVVALVLVPTVAQGVAGYSARVSTISTAHATTGDTVLSISIFVECPSGETFLGRVSVRAGGTTYSIGKIRGECQGTEVSVPADPWRTSEVPCFVEYTIGGQVRTSDGQKFPIQKVKSTPSCSDE